MMELNCRCVKLYTVQAIDQVELLPVQVRQPLLESLLDGVDHGLGRGFGLAMESGPETSKAEALSLLCHVLGRAHEQVL